MLIEKIKVLEIKKFGRKEKKIKDICFYLNFLALEGSINFLEIFELM